MEGSVKHENNEGKQGTQTQTPRMPRGARLLAVVFASHRECIKFLQANLIVRPAHRRATPGAVAPAQWHPNVV